MYRKHANRYFHASTVLDLQRLSHKVAVRRSSLFRYRV